MSPYNPHPFRSQVTHSPNHAKTTEIRNQEQRENATRHIGNDKHPFTMWVNLRARFHPSQRVPRSDRTSTQFDVNICRINTPQIRFPRAWVSDQQVSRSFPLLLWSKRRHRFFEQSLALRTQARCSKFALPGSAHWGPGCLSRLVEGRWRGRLRWNFALPSALRLTVT